MVLAPSEASILAAYGISRSQPRQGYKAGENEAPSVFRLQLCKPHEARQDEGAGRRRPCSAPVGAMSADEIRWLIGARCPRSAEETVGQSDFPAVAEMSTAQGTTPTNTTHAQERKTDSGDNDSRKRSQSPIIPNLADSFPRAAAVPENTRPHTAGECPLRIRRAASLSRIMEHQEPQQKVHFLRRVDTSMAPRSKSRYRAGFTRPHSRGFSSPRFPKRPPAFSGLSCMKSATPAVPSSPSQTLAELKRRRAKKKEFLQSRTDSDLHDDQVYFTDYAMRVRARKMWHRELKAAKEADQIVDATPALTPSSISTEGVLSSKGRQIILMEGTEKTGVAEAVERLLGRMRGLGEASECIKGLAVTAGLVPKSKKLPRLSGKGNNNAEVEKDLFTLQVRQLRGQLKDSLFDVIREQEVQADVAKTMADAFHNVHEKAAQETL